MSEENTPTIEITLNGLEAYFLNQAITAYIQNIGHCCSEKCDRREGERKAAAYLDGVRGKFIQFLLDADEQERWPEPAPHVNGVYKPRNAVEAAALV